MRIEEIWRYPVKSLQGEALNEAFLGAEGVEGDRRWAIWDPVSDLGLTARRVPELLFASAHMPEQGSPDSTPVQITLADGQRLRDDAALCDWLGREVVLRAAAEQVQRRYESPDDNAREDGTWHSFSGATAGFQDSEQARVSLLSRDSIGSWDPRRFRSNLLLDGSGEDELVGARVQIGEAIVMVRQRIQRCVMTTRAQPGGLERDPGVMRAIAARREGLMAVGAEVERAGRIAVGDRLRVLSTGH